MSSSGTTVGEAKIALKFSMTELSSSQKQIEGEIGLSGKTSSKLFAKNFASTLYANIVSAGFHKVLNTISNAMDTAINRVDTLNNSTKVFQALGYTSDETSRSMDKLVEYLDGLPTSMTTAVSGVQSLAASFGSLDAGTDYFIAMNDAGLAFGATTEMVENAINQLGQLSLDGPLDAATWNSLRNSGFSPVFAAMAKEAGITVGELKESFGAKGTKTVQDFLDELVRMDKEGTSSMESLGSIARENTNGIGTAMENVQNRIGKAIAKIIDHIGADKISAAINAISSSFSGMADVVIGLMDFLGQNQWILDSILIFFGAVLALGIAQKVATFFGTISTFMTTNPIVAGIALIIVALTWVLTHLEEVGAFFNAVFTAIGDFVGSVAENIGNFFSSVFEGIGQGLQAIGDFFGSVFGFIGDFVGSIFQGVWNYYNAVFTAIWNGVQAVGDFFHSIFQGIGDFIGNVFNGVKDAVLGAWNFIVGIFSGLANFFGSIFSSAWEAVKAVFSTGGRIFMGIVDGIANAFRTIVNAIITGINAVVAVPFNAINGFLGVLRGIDILGFKPFDWVGVIGVPQIPLLAQGGYANGASRAIIGESGKEVVLPLENNTDNWAGLLAKVLVDEMDDTDSNNVPRISIGEQKFTVNNGFDAREAGRQFIQEIRRLA